MPVNAGALSDDWRASKLVVLNHKQDNADIIIIAKWIGSQFSEDKVIFFYRERMK